jgi:hypothetical protein
VTTPEPTEAELGDQDVVIGEVPDLPDEWCCQDGEKAGWGDGEEVE